MNSRFRRIVRWTFKLGLWFVCGLAGLLLAGTIWQHWAAKKDATRFPPPGRMIDLGGRRLFLACGGSGSPTVVFDSGLGDDHTSWLKVYPEVAKFTRACVYDRAGMGWSDPGPLPRDSAHIVSDLHDVLAKAGEAGPFVLAGHSIAGCHIRVYAQRYRSEVAGLVLVDPTPAGAFADPGPSFAPIISTIPKLGGAVTRIAEFLSVTGVLRAIGSMQGEKGLAPQFRSADETTKHVAVYGPPTRQFRAIRDEEDSITDDARQAAAVKNLGDLPLTLLEARKPLTDSSATPLLGFFLPRGYDVHSGLLALQTAAYADHAGQAALSTRGRLVRAEKSDHYVQLDQPDLVISTIGRICGR